MGQKAIAATPQVIDTLKKANRLVNSTNLNVKQSESKQPISQITTTSISGPLKLIPAKIISGNGLQGYICDIFENGLNDAATSRGIVFLANGASTIHVLPAGTILYVQKTSVNVEGVTI